MTAAEVTTPAETGAELLARIRPVKRRVTTHLCLRADLIDEWQEADLELQRMRVEDAAKGRLASGVSNETRKQAQKVKALEDQIVETQVEFVLESMSRPEFKALCAAHPPRKDNIIDQTVGYDRDAVGDESVRLCLVEPVFDDASWAELVEVLNPSEWDELRTRAQEVNGKVVDAPKSATAAKLLDASRAKKSTASRPRNGGE